MSELKQCPFCGGEASVMVDEKNHDSFQIIGCGDLSMICPNPTMTVYRGDDGKFDYTHWNRRVENKGVNNNA